MRSMVPGRVSVHRGTLYFRLRVPQRLVSRLGSSDIKLSLRTGRLDEGRRIAARLAVAFDMLDLEALPMERLTPAQARAIVMDYLRRELEAAWDAMLLRKRPFTQEKLEERLSVLGDIQAMNREDLARHDYSRAEETASELLKANGREAEPGTPAHRLVSRELLRQGISAAKIESEMLQDVDFEPERIAENFQALVEPENTAPAQFIQSAQETRPQPIAKPQGPLLSELKDTFLAIKAKDWQSSTLEDEKPKLQLFVDLVGDIPASSLSIQNIIDFREKLEKFPANWRTGVSYRNMKPNQVALLSIPEEERMSSKTVLHYCNQVRAFIKFCGKQKHLDAEALIDPLTVKRTEPKREQRGFSTDELRKIFHAREYCEDGFALGWKFWLPILGLYTGARIEELAQLALDDVAEVEGLWCLRIRSGEGQGLKNRASARDVPLAPFIAQELNLPGYADKLRKKGERYLFPELWKNVAKRQKQDGKALKKSAGPSRWFGRFLTGLGITDSGAVFHSFRHTLASWGHETPGVQPLVLSRFLGHTPKGQTQQYGAVKVRAMYEQIAERLPWKDAIDLEHLVISKIIMP